MDHDGILLTPLVAYGLLFLLPSIYNGMSRRKADIVAGALYILFLLPSAFYFLFVSAAVIDTPGIDRHLPASVDLLAIVLLASLTATIVALIPLIPVRKKREIKRPVL
ncbi:hypothetical protein [Thermococcus stetteri]|uniref:hypothetical protein n=1 Tax=Thermococcus stetteri TaxID=49900 RepID=UPI001AE3CE10|nr:hypothetical protein [Thermococcus stetteri]MBP1912280.1 hypothetical protein [Thermococcus stetteri]